MLKFIHCADLHIDSPFKGLSEINPELQTLMYQSTYESFSKIVDLAISENVDCLFISGDIYDGEDKSLRAQLKFRNELKRLSDEAIPSFVVHGNHDPLSSWSATLTWPENVHIFPGNKVESIPLIKNGELLAKIYGISFAKRDITSNLALKFKSTDEKIFHIGLLHCNVGTNTGHDPYAPATIEELSSIGIDYWALGHIHKYSILKESDPTIVYPGSIQSRNARETGAKGCCLVSLEVGEKPDIRFVATDNIRFITTSVDISQSSNLDEIVSAIENRCESIASGQEGRNIIIRIYIIGRTSLHKELQKGDSLNGLTEQMRDYFSNMEPFVWIEKLLLQTIGTYDLESIRKGNDFISDIVSIYDDLEKADSVYWSELEETYNTLFSFWPGQKYLSDITKEELIQLSKESHIQGASATVAISLGVL